MNQRRRGADLFRQALAVVLTFMLVACASGEAQSDKAAAPTGSCLFVVKLDGGRMLKWGACNSPPPLMIEQMR